MDRLRLESYECRIGASDFEPISKCFKKRKTFLQSGSSLVLIMPKIKIMGLVRLALYFFRWTLIVLALAGCNPFAKPYISNRDSNSGGNFDSAPPPIGGGTLSLSVEKIYPANGATWLSYISAGVSGTTLFDRTDAACVGTESGDVNSCFHGGDKLKIVVSQLSSCSGLTLTDSEGVFIWSCFVDSGQVVFKSTGYQDGKGLSDLIDFVGLNWKSMSVTLNQNGSLKGQSTSQRWWSIASNPIVNLPSSAGSLQTISGFASGTILVLNSDMVSKGYNIDQDSIAIVVKSGNKIDLEAGLGNNCNYSNGENAGANTVALICAGSQKHIWIEGEYNDPTHYSDPIFSLFSVKFSTFHKVTVNQGPSGNILYAVDSSYNRYTRIKAQNMSGNYSIFYYVNSSYNYLYDFVVSKVLATSYFSFVEFDSSSGSNILTKATFSQHTRSTVHVDSSNNIITDIVNIAGDRFSIGSSKNTISHVSSFGMSNYGFIIDAGGGASPTQNTVNQYLSANNYYSYVQNGTTSTLTSQLSIYTDQTFSLGLSLSNNTNSKHSNALIMSDSGSGNNCYVGGGSNQGLVDATCAMTGLSDGIKITYPLGMTLTPVYGALSGVDAANSSSQSSGVVSASTITDSITFSNRFRAWGSQASQGICTGTDSCVIYDVRLKSSDTVFRNTSLDGQNQNSAFVAGATCPSAVSGNKVLVDQSDTPRTFLINAQEIIEDGLGNENGLCESGEACIYSPNFGAYQGDGDYKSNGTCVFQNGAVSNVIMYAYPSNGI